MKNSLPKFLVYFRRPDDYRGEFGFDWIRDEYIYPIVKVAIDNKGYTDNFMDYYEPISNSKSPIKISFYHWQWAIMQYEVNNYIEK